MVFTESIFCLQTTVLSLPALLSHCTEDQDLEQVP